MHSDLFDCVIFFIAPMVLLFGAVMPPRLRAGSGALGCVLVGGLLVDLARLLPLPESFPGALATADSLRLSMMGIGVAVGLAPLLVTELRSVWPLACTLAAPALSLVVFTTAAVAAANPMTLNATVALTALSRAGKMVDAITLILAVAFACLPGRPGVVRGALRVLVIIGVGSAARAWWPGGSFAVLWTVLLALIPPVVNRQRVRDWLGDRVDAWQASPRLPWIVAASLAGVLLVGVAASTGHLPAPMLTKQSGTGWVDLGAAVLPLTGVYLLLPLLLASLSALGPTTLKLPAHGGTLGRTLPPWLGLGVVATLTTMASLVLQKETGLTVLVGIALMAWWIAASARAGLTVVGTLCLLGVGVAAYAAVLFCPSAVAVLGEKLDRLGWLVFSIDDARMWQPAAAMSAAREGGVWGMGFLDPGGPGFAATPAWTNDFLVLTTIRFVGVSGLGLVVAAVLPAIAMPLVAREADFKADCDASRFFALFAAPWAACWGGAVLWISAGNLRLLPLSGVTAGLAEPANNHLAFSLVALGWMFSRTASRASASTETGRGLRWSLGLVGLTLGMAAGLLTKIGGERLADRAVAFVLPADMAEWVPARVTHDGDGIRLSSAVGQDVGLEVGDAFTIGPLRLMVGVGPSVAVAGFRADVGDLARGFHLGAAGRASLPHLVAGGAARSNDVWLEGKGPTRWRELTLRRSGGQIVAEAPSDGSAIEVASAGGAVCSAAAAGAVCPLTDGDCIRVRGQYEFVVHLDGGVLIADWVAGAPTSWPIEADHDILLGDRTLASREVRDQVYDRAARPVVALLGQYGALRVDGGVLRVTGRPTAPSMPHASEAELVAMAQDVFDAWLRPSETCPGGWTWRGRKPLGGGDTCVASSQVSRLVTAKDGAVVDVRNPNTQPFPAVKMPEGRQARGTVRDVDGTALEVYTDGAGWTPVDPSLGWLGARKLALNATETAVTGSYTGVERIFHNILGGRAQNVDAAEEFRRRWAMEPRPAGADVILTLSLPLQRAVAAEAAREALVLITEAKSQEQRRMRAEGRSCLAYDVSVVVTTTAGEIRAAVTAVGYLDAVGEPQVRFETGSEPDPCLPPFDGALRALSSPVPVGSPWKLAVWSAAIDAALGGDPLLRFRRDGDELRLLDPGDPDNGDGTYLVDHGVLRTVLGKNVPDCANHHEEGAEAPAYGVVGVRMALGLSLNTPACYVSTLLGGARLTTLLTLLQADVKIPLFPTTGDAVLDRELLDDAGAHALFATGGDAALLRDGTLTSAEATKLAVGQDATLTGIGLNGLPRMVAAGGRYAPPHLLRAIRFVDGREVVAPPPPSWKVVEPEAAAWVLAGMRGSVEFGTSSKAMAELDSTQRARLAVKTGTPDLATLVGNHLVPLRSHKVAVGVYPADGPTPLVISVWCRQAEGLDRSRAALNVIRNLVAAGSLENDGRVDGAR